ncbi:hypothetical protein [Diaphorobacter sp.]|uniref:hypothetical protein n=1 Tax=Diaphorobacter sp. TaxID=1934310 RepID=UPI003D0B70D4
MKLKKQSFERRRAGAQCNASARQEAALSLKKQLGLREPGLGALAMAPGQPGKSDDSMKMPPVCLSVSGQNNAKDA